MQSLDERVRIQTTWTPESINFLDPLQFSDESKALMIKYIQGQYAVLDPTPLVENDMDEINAAWSTSTSPILMTATVESAADGVADALGVDSMLLATLGNAFKRHRDAEFEVERLKRAMDDAAYRLREAETDLEKARISVKNAIQ